jgi:hypothetical protein
VVAVGAQNAYVDMSQVMRTLHESGYTGAVISDHLPNMVDGRRSAEAFALATCGDLSRLSLDHEPALRQISIFEHDQR